MADRWLVLGVLGCAAALLGGCDRPATGPITVSVIGPAPRLANPNLQTLDPPAAFLTEAVAQGLVRFDATGEIEPALAQSWIVSDDGLRYTFRIRRLTWPGGQRVTAEQVASRLRAAISRPSRNPLKPVLFAIANVVAMTDEVLEIQLRGPRPNFLQLLAQPEMAILLNGGGTGPYRIEGTGTVPIELALPMSIEEERGEGEPAILLWGQRAAVAVARFVAGEVELVTGGTIDDLAIARAGRAPRGTLTFDRAPGLFGLAFSSNSGALAGAEARRALAMAIDRETMAAALDAPGFDVRTSLVPAGTAELPQPAAGDWAALSMPMRREAAARIIAGLALEAPLTLRVAMPDGPGYRVVFAHLRRDWRRIGVDAVRVAPNDPAELRLIDAVAPANLPTWYLRFFTCEASPICDETADGALQRARLAANPAERQAALAEADRAMATLTPYIALASPVRWSLVSRRLNGFRANSFARHPASELIAEDQ